MGELAKARALDRLDDRAIGERVVRERLAGHKRLHQAWAGPHAGHGHRGEARGTGGGLRAAQGAWAWPGCGADLQSLLDGRAAFDLEWQHAERLKVLGFARGAIGGGVVHLLG